jgi:hypothetical protein
MVVLSGGLTGGPSDSLQVVPGIPPEILAKPTGKGKGQLVLLTKQAHLVKPFCRNLGVEQLGPQELCLRDPVGDGRAVSSLPTEATGGGQQHVEELCPGEPLGGGKECASLPPEAGGEEEVDEEAELLRSMLQSAVRVRDDLSVHRSKKARRHFLASIRPMVQRMEAMPLSPVARAVLAEIQLCIG